MTVPEGTIEYTQTLVRQEPTSIENAIARGLGGLFDINPHTTILVLIICILIWFIRYLLNEAKDERKLNREALVNSTEVIAELKELIRGAIHK